MLCFELPDEYPSQLKPIVNLEFDGAADNARRRVLRDDLQRVLDSIEPGIECIDEIITAFQASLDLSGTRATDVNKSPSSDDLQSSDKKDDEKKLILIWTHHLLSTQKRKFIRDRSDALALVGYSKPGYPGVIVVEGFEGDVDLFVRELKELRWQALSVKSERSHQYMQLDPRIGLQEVESMSEMTKELAKAGLEEWFITGIGLRKGDPI